MGLTRGTIRLVVSPDIRGYENLKGKTLGVDSVSTGYSLVLKELLQRGGLEESDYHLLSVGATKLRAQALMQGKFSATILTTPLEMAPESRGYRRLANAVDELGAYQTIVGISRHGWAQAHRNDLVAFIRATIDAIDWLFEPNNRVEARAIYRRHLPNTPEEDATREVDALLDEREGFSPGAAFDPQGITTVLRIRSTWGTPRKSLTEPKRYVDESYLRAAKRAPR
jgi:ABC-type nitrate/sulfonate/bicarbonate transport system substrate-binding protein